MAKIWALEFDGGLLPQSFETWAQARAAAIEFGAGRPVQIEDGCVVLSLYPSPHEPQELTYEWAQEQAKHA